MTQTEVQNTLPRVLSKQDMLMGSLKTFFSVPENLGKMIPILTQKSKISLRLLDWFVTNYAKKKNICYFIDYNKNGEKKQRYFNVFLNYKSQLKAYSKQQFDPFCRKWKPHKGKRVYCGIHFYYKKDRYVETTVGQLNFFRWIVANKVLDYAIEHLTAIQRDMLVNASKTRTSTKKYTKKSTNKTSTKSQNAKTNEVKGVTDSVQAIKNSIPSKGESPPVSINATKKITKKHIQITVDFN
jgi:hypothetical protein